MAQPLFASFFLAGFEASTQRRRDGVRIDVVEATRHDELAEPDFTRMLRAGIRTAREGTAWYRIEARPGRFDFASLLNRVRVAHRLGIQVIWDLCHFGWPEDTDPFEPEFPERLGRFAGAFARLLASETDAVPWFAPVNEISFVAWAAGDVEYLNPFQRGRGDELKAQLVRAAIAAGAAVREVDPRARIVHIDPIIHIEPNPKHPERDPAVAAYNEVQFAAWDMLAGRARPELGGSMRELDVIGVNFYDRNQWLDLGPTLRSADPGYRPLRELLAAVHARYDRPVFVAETGAEARKRVPWMRYVCDEVAAAQANGTPIDGICLYPVMDHPGWDNDRHIEVGLWGYPDTSGHRPPYRPLMDELRRQQTRFEPTSMHVSQPGGLPMTDHDRANAASRERIRNLLVTLDPSAPRPDDGGWTAAETLAHMAFWDRFALERWQRAERLHQEVPDLIPEGIPDMVNDAVIGHWSAIPLQAAAELAERAAGEVDGYVARLSPQRIAAARAGGAGRLVDRSLHRNGHLDSLEASLGG